MVSLSECIPWMTVGLAESVAIVTLNLCTIIVFMRNRNLRKRSMYLVINLAVTDMFVGGVAAYYLFYWSGVYCNLWEWPSLGFWTFILLHIFTTMFVICSLVNIVIIALERVHATFFPLRHRVVKKHLYRLIICVAWVISALITITYTLVVLNGNIYHGVYLHVTFLLICLLVICVSYTSIVIKIRCGAQPRYHGAANRERKLTMTLLIVTVVSLLLYLPFVIWRYVIYASKFEINMSMPLSVLFHLESALLVLMYANSLLNPILYAVRMPEYRSAFLALVRKRPQQQREVAVFPLREM